MAYNATLPLDDGGLNAGDIRENFRALKEDSHVIAASIAGQGALATLSSVGAAQIDTDAVGALELANNSVASANVINNSLTADDINANAINWSELNTSASTTSVSVAGESTSNSGVFAAGGKGFSPRMYCTSTASGSTAILHWLPVSATAVAPLCRVTNANASTRTFIGTMNYVDGSPPYDIGDGEVGHFIFIKMKRGTKEIVATYVANCAPWHYNGPTDISADSRMEGKNYYFRKIITPEIKALHPQERVVAIRELGRTLIEVTPMMKNIDMDLIPHPFVGNVAPDEIVVMVDATSDITIDMKELNADGENVSEIIHGGYFNFGEAMPSRTSPNGVIVVPATWKPPT